METFSISKFPTSPIANHQNKAEKSSHSVTVRSPMIGASYFRSQNAAMRNPLPLWDDCKTNICQNTDSDFPQLLYPKFGHTFESVEVINVPDNFSVMMSPKGFPAVTTNFPAISSARKKRSTSIQLQSKFFFNPLKNSEGAVKDGVILQDKISNKSDEETHISNSVKLRKLNALSGLTRLVFRPIANLKKKPSGGENELYTPQVSRQPAITKAKNRKKVNETKLKSAADKKKKRHISCCCKNSRCLKFYCECFRNKGFCGSYCRCLECKNISKFSDDRKKALKEILKKNVQGCFSGHGQETTNTTRSPKQPKRNLRRGIIPVSCNCRKSKCLKDYCGCFSGGGFCLPTCQCVGCANRSQESTILPQKTNKELKHF